MASKPVEDCKQVVVPLTVHLPTMSASVIAPTPSSASMRALSALSACCRVVASLLICCCSPAASGMATQVILLPLGSEDCIACPAGHPVTLCAQAPWAPNVTTAAARPQRQYLLMNPSPLVDQREKSNGI